MKKIKEFVLTKDFVIKSSFGLIGLLFFTIISMILFFVMENRTLTKEFTNFMNDNKTKTALIKKDIVYIKDDIKEIKYKIKDKYVNLKR